MRNMKTLSLILLTVALLIGFAYLPGITAAAQDASFSGVGFHAIRQVELVISQPEAAGDILGKMALLRNGSFYTVSPSKTNIAQSEIEQVVRDELNPYYEAELVPYNWASYEFSAVPHLVSDTLDTDSYAIVWIVSIHWPDSGDHLDLYVDDGTGMILHLHFASGEKLETYTAFGYLGTLSTTFLNSTGLMEIMNDPGSWNVEYVTHDTQGLKNQQDPWISYKFIHRDYGETEVQFWLYDHGFYTLIC